MIIALVRRCAAFAVCLVVTVSGVQAAQRTFVSTGGLDTNPCSLAAPCRAFAKAITVTDPGGEIVVLDSGGYGGMTVNKNVSILAPAGVYAGISVFAASDGIIVAAPATKVVLRGLAINGQGGNNGVRVQAGEVHIESSVISNLTQAGILVEAGSSVRVSGTVVRSNADGLKVAPSAGSVAVLVRESEFSNHSNAGVSVAPSGGTTAALVTVERSSATKNGAGLVATPAGGANATLVIAQSVTSENAGAGVASQGTGATVFVRESAVTRNGTGLFQASSGVLNACGGNLLVANTTAQSGAINTASCLDVAGGAGTVTSVATGAGLTGGPITTSGTIDLASTQLLPTVACAPNQIPKWNGSNWTCGADNVGPANAFVENGNAFGATAVLGTTDNFPLVLKANNLAALTITPDATSPTIVAGSSLNTTTAGASAATIGGGGAAGTTMFGTPCGASCANRVTDAFGTVAGGIGNQAGDNAGTASDQPFATVGGGINNVAANRNSTIGGGTTNSVTTNAGTIAGGQANTASGLFGAAVGGGSNNTASGQQSTVGGGGGNQASGQASTIPGGAANEAAGAGSFVTGFMAKNSTPSHSGVFLFSDATGIFNVPDQHDFPSLRAKEFAARATGGVRFVTAIDPTTGAPTETFSIVPGGKVGINTDTPEATATLTVKDASGPTIFLQNTASNQIESGRIRFADQSNAANCVGAYLHYDGVGNIFHIGRHNTTGCVLTDDVDVINVRRTDGFIGLLASGNSTNPLTVGTDTTNGNGAHLTAGGVWTNGSSRTFKEAFEPIDAQWILARVVELPIGTWRYKGETTARHIGPVAEDFHAAFGLGGDERYIGTVDADGVALAAIQGLHLQMRQRDRVIDAQQQEITALKRSVTEIDSLRAELASLKMAIRQRVARTAAGY